MEFPALFSDIPVSNEWISGPSPFVLAMTAIVGDPRVWIATVKKKELFEKSLMDDLFSKKQRRKLIRMPYLISFRILPSQSLSSGCLGVGKMYWKSKRERERDTKTQERERAIETERREIMQKHRWERQREGRFFTRSFSAFLSWSLDCVSVLLSLPPCVVFLRMTVFFLSLCVSSDCSVRGDRKKWLFDLFLWNCKKVPSGIGYSRER